MVVLLTPPVGGRCLPHYDPSLGFLLLFSSSSLSLLHTRHLKIILNVQRLKPGLVAIG